MEELLEPSSRLHWVNNNLVLTNGDIESVCTFYCIDSSMSDVLSSIGLFQAFQLGQQLTVPTTLAQRR